MTPKKCMSIAKSLTNTQHMELEPLCSGACENNFAFKSQDQLVLISVSLKVPFM